MIYRRVIGHASQLAALAMMLLAVEPVPAETPETILIRAALDKDLRGRRRANVELMVKAYDEDRFVVYDGHASASASGWDPVFDDRDVYARQLASEVESHRYEIQRTVVVINVWKDKAFVTTTDSGFVVDRASSERVEYFERRLWTLAKLDEEWLVTGIVADYGDLTAGARPSGIPNQEAQQVVELLMDEAGAWSDGSASGITGAADEAFVAVESKFSSNPAEWLIMFTDRDEYGEWLDKRLERVDYTITREVIHVSTGADGREAVAVSRDQVRAAPLAGDAVYEQERLNYWLLHKKGGDWVVSWVFWKSKEIPFTSNTAALR